MCRADQ